MALILRNIDASNVDIPDLGITLTVGQEYDLTEDEPWNISQSIDLPAQISAGRVIILDPLDDITPLTISQSIAAAAAMNDTHYRIRGGDLTQLDDTSFGSPITNDILQFNGTSWTNAQPIDETVKISSNDTTPGFLNGKLVAGTGITLTVNNPGGNETLTITSTGGGASPGGVDTNVQYNNGGVFGGENNFIYDDVNKRIEVNGPALTTRGVYHVGTDTLDLAQVNKSAIYVQIDGDSTYEGHRIYFKRTQAGISGWITYHYDQATPNMRLTDEDDDPPYISFRTIGTGTFDAPEFESSFGARGTTANRTTGFSWWLGNSTEGGTEIMSCDSNFLSLPSDTTANRPSPATNGMVRYNTTTNKFEGFENGTWRDLISFHSHLSRHNGNITQTFTALTIINFGTNIRTDSDYTHALNIGGSEITINRAGWYKLTYEVSFNDTTGTRTNTETRFELNGTIITGTTAYAYHRNSVAGKNTSSSTTKINLSVGDVVRVRARVVAGNAVVTLANSCRLNIESIDGP